MDDVRRIARIFGSGAEIEAEERWLRTLVDIPSGSGHAPGLEGVQAVLARELAALGLAVERRDGGVLVARGHAPGARPRVLLVGHADTVYAPGDPFSGLTETRDGAGRRMLRGPGAADMKGGLVVALRALHALKVTGRLERGAVTVLVNRDEETGSPESAAVVRAVSAGHDLALVLEPGFDRKDGASTVVVERAGLARVRVRVHGVEAHAGNQPERGLSAVATAARLVAPLDALAAPGRGRLVRVCTFEGGRSINQVPGRAVLGVDVRFRSLRQWEGVQARIREIAAAPGDRNPLTGARTRTEVEIEAVKPPMPRLPGAEGPLRTLLAVADALGQRLAPGRRNGTSDGNHTAQAGTPTLDGLGAVGVGMHVSGEEAVRASSLPERAAVLAGTLSVLWGGR